MNLFFWEQVLTEMKRQNTIYETLAQEIGIDYCILNQWVSQGILPTVDYGVKIATALNTTAEHLVRGKTLFDQGRMSQFFFRFYPFFDLLKDLETLTESQLSSIKIMIAGLSEKNAKEFFKIRKVKYS
jgi:type II secretory pathway component PulM